VESLELGTFEDLPPGQVREFIHGERVFAVANLDGQLFAIDGTCPHLGGPLGHGNLIGSHVVCPWHEWAFNCRTGALDFNPGFHLRTYPVRVDNGKILVVID
jgi:nitrite reductase (NADH) small subunit